MGRQIIPEGYKRPTDVRPWHERITQCRSVKADVSFKKNAFWSKQPTELEVAFNRESEKKGTGGHKKA